MKKLLFKIILIACLTITGLTKGMAQVAINTDASLPDASAMLDVKAGNKGLLIPRVALNANNDALTVPSPATYLMVINTNALLANGIGLYINLGTPQAPNWVKNGGNVAASNAWLLNGNAGTNNTNFLGTTDARPLRFGVNNNPAGYLDPTTGNVVFGLNAFPSNAGTYMVAIGNEALNSQTTNPGGFYYNVAVGSRALYKNTIGQSNTGIGNNSMYENIDGNNNSALGDRSLFNNTTGSNNTATGAFAMLFNKTGSNNTSSGLTSLWANISGNGNSSFGFRALYRNETGYSNVALQLWVLRLCMQIFLAVEIQHWAHWRCRTIQAGAIILQQVHQPFLKTL